MMAAKTCARCGGPRPAVVRGGQVYCGSCARQVDEEDAKAIAAPAWEGEPEEAIAILRRQVDRERETWGLLDEMRARAAEAVVTGIRAEAAEVAALRRATNERSEA